MVRTLNSAYEHGHEFAGSGARRTAITLLEVAVAAAILATLITLSVKMLRTLGDQQLAVQQQVLALDAIEAISEQLGNTPWDELTTDTAGGLTIPAPLQSYLPRATVDVSIQTEEEPTRAKRVAVRLTWNGPRGLPAHPVQLTTWVFPDDVE